MTDPACPDGAAIWPCPWRPGKYLAHWSDVNRVPSDNDDVSVFASAMEAMEALREGGEGPGRKLT